MLKLYKVSTPIDEEIRIQDWWNDTDRGKVKYLK